MSQIELLNKFDLTNRQIAMTVQEITDALDEAEVLPILSRLTAMEKVLTGVKDYIKDRILDEASKYPEKTFTLKGVRYEKKSKKTYSYDHCVSWTSKKADLKKIEDLMKSITASVADTETGEIIEPAHFKTTEYLAVNLPE